MTTTSTMTDNRSEIDRLTAEIETLIDRLENGQDLYDKETDPARKERIYRKWQGLLDEYTAKCDERRRLGYVYPA